MDLTRATHLLPAVVPVKPAQAGARAEVRPPGSKSLTNRALLLAALARGSSELRGALTDADDAQRMIAALRQLGAGITITPGEHGGTVRVAGVGGQWRPGPANTADRDSTGGGGGEGRGIESGGGAAIELNLNNAGTATRFLAAAALLAPIPVTIDGNPRMRQRPIGELGDALAAIGCRIDYLAAPGCPPMRITPPAAGVDTPTLDMGTTQSGQFISALLLVGPWLRGGLTIRMSGPVTSASYVQMTLGLLGRLGAEVRAAEDLRVMRVGPAEGVGDAGGIGPFSYDVEPDASGATYFWGAGAIIPGARVRVRGLGEASLQGDSDFPELLERMGARVTHGSNPNPEPNFNTEDWIEVHGTPRGTLRPIVAEMHNMPDAAMTLAAVACFATGTTVIRGVRTLRVKESDRVLATRAELAKIGVRVEFPYRGDEDQMAVTPPPGGVECSPDASRVDFDTYDDHRMAMSLALIGLRRPNVWIRNPACVAKTYPDYWTQLARLADAT